MNSPASKTPTPPAPAREADRPPVPAAECGGDPAALPLPAPLLVDAAGLGALLGVSRATVFRLDKADRLPDGLRLGSCRRWAVAEVRAWVAAGMPGRFEWRARQRRREEARRAGGKGG